MNNEMAQEKDLWEVWGRRFEDLAIRHPLRILFWQTTLRCDSSCLYCSSPQEWWKPESELSTNEICRALESIAKDFDLDNIAQLSFTGGEPLLRHDLPVVSSHATDLGFKTLAIQTNGYLASKHPDLVEKLINAGITVWGINIDGPASAHNGLRKSGRGFANAVTFAEQLCRDVRLNTTISTLICRKNIKTLSQVYDLVTELKPDLWRIAHFDPIGRGAEVGNEYLLSPSNLHYLLDFLADIRAQHQGNPNAFEVEIGCGGWLGRDWEGVVRPYVFHCVSGLDTMTILYDGGITGCPVVSRELIQGNVREERVKDVWENRFEFFRNPRQRVPEQCLTCSDWTYCHGGCLHNYKRSEEDWTFSTCLRVLNIGYEG